MKKLKVFIAEDDKVALKRLLNILRTLPEIIDVNNVVTSQTLEEAQKLLLVAEKFDFSILDINLDGEKTSLILINEYNGKLGAIAIATLDVENKKSIEKLRPIIHYETLEKPYTEINVTSLINKIIQRINNDKKLHEYSSDILLIPNATGKQLVNVNDIIFIVVENKFSYIHFIQNGVAILLREEKSLSEFEKILNEKQFYRIHDKYLVNKNYIRTVEQFTVVMKYEFQLTDNSIKTNSLPIAERRRANFMAFLYP